MRLEPGDELLTLRECEALTKRKVSTFRSDIRQGNIPHVRIGRLVRIRRSDLNRIVSQGFRPAVSVNL